MSAILAILLMLSGALLIPRAFAQVPADSVESNPLTISYLYPAHGPGDAFAFDIDVVHVDGLFSFQVGFRFDHTAIQIDGVTLGSYLTSGGGGVLSFPGSIDNVNGIVGAYGWTLQDVNKVPPALGVGQHGQLVHVTAHINAALWPPYTDGYPGGPVSMCDLTTLDMDPCELVLMYKDGVTEITPPEANLGDGFFTLAVLSHGPTAAFSWTPVPSYDNEPVHFDASGSSPGWNGWANVPIDNYHWDFGDGNITDTASPLIDHTFTWTPPPDIMIYTVTLTVTAGTTGSDDQSHDVTVIVRPTGPSIDLESQRWRYQDPTFVVDPFFGEGPHFDCDLFRPGEMVEMWVYVSYNGDPVQNQLIAYEVKDNNDNTVLAGTAQSDSNGWAYYQFRIPWPCTGPEPLFGTWKAIAKWSVGEMGGKPWMKTYNDTMNFQVGWGIYIKDKQECDAQGNPKGAFHKSELVYVKIHLQNDYMMARVATITAVIYDDLMVPINTPAILVDYNLMPGQTYVLMVGIHVEKWAYVGTGTCKVNVFTKLPFLCGTSFAPEVTNTFQILKSDIPPWVPDP